MRLPARFNPTTVTAAGLGSAGWRHPCQPPRTALVKASRRSKSTSPISRTDRGPRVVGSGSPRPTGSAAPADNRSKGRRDGRLVRHTGGVLLLAPADPLRPRRADEHFAAEATAARDAGITVAFIDHDALADPGGAEQAVARVPDAGSPAVYRGWMMSSASYTALAAALTRPRPPHRRHLAADLARRRPGQRPLRERRHRLLPERDPPPELRNATDAWRRRRRG
jgi:hypothetical protein